jgi:lipopolysaccharide export system permease protein
LSSNPKSQEVILRLFDGDIHRFDSGADVYHKIKFNAYDLKLELAKALSNMGKKLRDHELSVEDIKQKIEKRKGSGEDATPQEVELHKRYAIPFACIVFGLIGVPLGIQPRRSGRSFGFVSAFSFCWLTTFPLQAQRFWPSDARSSLFGRLAPNVIFGGFGIYLLIKTAKESPSKLVVWLIETFDLIQRKWKGRF